jgi:RNA polymerase subunit RPABC4/transcription elongation factor Spt4
MHVCNKCEHLFDEPAYIEEREVIDYGIGSQWVTLFEGDVCPNCESNDIDVYYVSKEGN